MTGHFDGIQFAAFPATPGPFPAPPVWYTTANIDGTDYEIDATSGADGSLDHFDFGGTFPAGATDCLLDNLKVGTSPGGTDIFSDDFSGATIVPPFDSVTGSGLSLSSGRLHVVSAAAAAYATKALPPVAEIHFEFDVYMDPVVMASQDTVDFLDIYTTGGLAVGLYASTGADATDPANIWNDVTESFGVGTATTGAWHTVKVKLVRS